MKDKYDVIIIGAGIIGCCTAFEMTKKGYKTLNIDFQHTAGAGSTSNSCGNVRFYYSTRDGVALAYESAWYWHHWQAYLETEAERGYAPFKNTGSIFIKSNAIDWPKVKKNFDEVGVRYEEWDLEMLKQKVPVADFHSFFPPKRPDDPLFYIDPKEMLSGACYTPESGYVSDPLLATQNVEAATKAKGGEFLYRKKVTQILQENGRVVGVVLDDGTRIFTDVLVNASGPHSFKITKMAGLENNNKIKTRALRHEVHVIAPPDGYSPEKEGFHTNDTDIGQYHRPESGNLMLTGSVDPKCDPREFVDPDDFNTEVTLEQWKAQIYRLARRFPGLRIPETPRGIADLYDVTDDWLPIYDKSDLKGYYQAIGTSGNQFKTAPVVGGMMAHMIEKIENGYDHDKSPIQYKLPLLDITIDTSVFHRNRDVNQNSSFSVIG